MVAVRTYTIVHFRPLVAGFESPLYPVPRWDSVADPAEQLDVSERPEVSGPHVEVL